METKVLHNLATYFFWNQPPQIHFTLATLSPVSMIYFSSYSYFKPICVFIFKWVYCRQHIVWSCFFIHSDNPCLLFGVCRLLTFEMVSDIVVIDIVIINMVVIGLDMAVIDIDYYRPYSLLFSICCTCSLLLYLSSIFFFCLSCFFFFN